MPTKKKSPTKKDLILNYKNEKRNFINKLILGIVLIIIGVSGFLLLISMKNNQQARQSYCHPATTTTIQLPKNEIVTTDNLINVFADLFSGGFMFIMTIMVGIAVMVGSIMTGIGKRI